MLAQAAQSNNTDAVQLMLAAGWPMDERGQQGGTPLHWAGFHGNTEMARVIFGYRGYRLQLELSADERYDGTPLGWAVDGSAQS